MFDDECFPEGHPLQSYLEELNLAETSKEQRRPLCLSMHHALSFVLREFKLLYDTLTGFHPYVFYPSECLKVSSLRRLRASCMSVESSEILKGALRKYDGSPRNHRYIAFNALFFTLTLIGVIRIGSTSTWMVCAAVLVMLLLSTLSVISLAIVRTIGDSLEKVQTQTLNVEQIFRSCIGFLQEYETRSCFGFGKPAFAGNVINDYPCFRMKLRKSMHSHVESTIRLLEEFRSSFEDALYVLSPPQLEQLRVALESDSAVSDLEDSKMLREVLSLLVSDLFTGVINTACSISVWSVPHLLRLLSFLRLWVYELNQLKGPVEELKDLVAAIQQGSSDIGETIDTPNDTAVTNPIPTHQLVRSLLFHLLVALQRTRKLKDLFEENPLTVEDQEESVQLLDHIRCHLEACENFRDELTKLLSSAYSEKTTELNPSSTSGGDDFVFSELQSDAVTKTLLTEDIVPEDDVLEAVALGESSEEDNEEAGEDGNEIPVIPLHSSVLKELRTAIVCRRLAMQEREERALERRIHSIHGPETTEAFEAQKDKKPLPSQSEPATNTDKTPDTTAYNCLNEFFPSETDQSQSPQLTRCQVRLKHSCSWRPQSAVAKRIRQFRPLLSGDHEDGQPSLSQDSCQSDKEASPDNHTFQPPHPVNGGQPPITSHQPRRPFNPFLSDPSFARKLFAQRKKIGYAEEESFVAVGTCEEGSGENHSSSPEEEDSNGGT
ncbi:unnamed protein product [Calicophoron daubneyi]|uniref:Vezatin n=1 Tax=Calicophoron daubneyi TaxID=300641 RepID=A0AAV2TQ21_CALDB